MSEVEADSERREVHHPAREQASNPYVLLVDDQPARLLTYESVLEGVGVTCVRALSGEEALGRLLKQSFALILMDVSMPGMDGFETARLIREHPRFERTPIIFVTGVRMSELDSLRGYEVGAIDYIPVPVVPEILRSKVALLVELYRRRTELEALNRRLEATRAQLELERSSSLAASRLELDASEARYRAIFENPMALTALLRAVRNETGEVLDWTYVDANAAALELLESPSQPLLGRRLSTHEGDGPQLFPAALCTRVLAEGRARRYESTAGGRDFLMCLFPMDKDTLAGSGVDITARIPLHVALRERERRARTLLRLGDTFRALTDPADLAHAAARILGETLAVDRCGYGTIDPIAETITVERDWNAPGIKSLAGVLNFRDYGTYIDDLKRGETVICSDARLDARTSATAGRLEALSARSFVNMPIMESGAFVALLYLNHGAPRLWSEDERDFIREIAERTRIAVERRRGEQSVAADLRVTRLLRDLAAREVAENDVQVLFEEILAAAIEIAGARAGTLQLLDEAAQELYFAATQGVDAALVAHFARVDAASPTACGAALASGLRSFVDYDVLAPGADPDGSLRLHVEHGLRSGQSTPLVSRSGRRLGMISTHWSDHRRPSERELRYLDLLARQTADLIERTQAESALHSSAERLREADRRKDEFIAMLAHELRNPLVPIRTAVELLKRAPEQPSLIATVRPMMERQVGHMVRLIDDLLDVSRITSGRIELKPEPASLSSLVAGAIDANREAIAAAGLDLSAHLEEPHLMLNVDPTRFTQILSNLIQNAAKFTPAGGRITLAAASERGAAAADAVLRIVVSDTGIGISEELLPRIFDLFAQAGTAGQGRHSGLGIGLALARRLTEMHGGTLVAESAGPDRGSDFTLRIPLPMSPRAAESAESDESAALGGLRVTVIDDNRDAADVMGMLVEDMGGTVRVAYDGLSGIAAALEFKPAVILLDIGMPGMDGYETCRRLRAELGAGIGIIALTGWGQEQYKRRAAESGFDAHLTKPADPRQLADLIRSLMHRTRGGPR